MKRIVCPALTKKKEFVDLFEQMIDYLIQYNEDVTTDDLLVDMIEDGEKRQEAFELLLSWLIDDQGYLHSYNEVDLEMDQLKSNIK